MKAIQTPALSPDGTSVLFTLRRWVNAGAGADVAAPAPATSGKKLEKKELRAHVWMVRVGPTGPAGEARQITYSDKDETAPAWSPDGRFISFLSARGGGAGGDAARPQIYVMRTDGGEAWKLTEAKEGVTAFVWSPDAKQIAFTSRDSLPKEVDDRRKAGDDPRVFEGDFRYVHIWVVDVESKKATQVTSGEQLTVGGVPSWAPDGRRLVFAGPATPMARDPRSDLYTVALDSRSVEKITMSPGRHSSPAWSPDGSTIAYLSQPLDAKPQGDGIPPEPITGAHLVLFDVAARRHSDVASPQFQRGAGNPVWTPDSKRIIFSTADRVYTSVYAYEAAARRYVQITKEKMITLGTFSKDGSRVAFQMESTTAPSDVYVADQAFASPIKLTTVNPQAADFALGETEVVRWKSADGLDVEGLLVKPVGYQPGKRYPMLTVIHGGPAAVHRNFFRVRTGDAAQYWAGQGWAVLLPNPRGSVGYGDTFLRAAIRDWGGGDFKDIMAGVDAMIERGIADPDRLAEMGWSYGGYMTCRIVTETTRFKAAMMGAGLANLTSMYGTTDVPGLLAVYFGGMPSAETLPLYADRSGLTHVDRVTTPLLMLQGANDDRVPVGQSMEFYRALKDRGKTVELVFYPREGHGPSEYYHQLDRLRREYDWITKYTLGDGAKKITTR
jgi:dipeptidyl aminopeptidase/acylaminoacyl peptidase